MSDDPTNRSDLFPVGYWKAQFQELLHLQSALDQMLEEATQEQQPLRTPRSELKEEADFYRIRFDLPGMTKENIRVEIIEGALIVHVHHTEHEEKQTSDEQETSLSAVRCRSFTRSFPLPAGVAAEETKARFENGILNVTIPKARASKTKLIEIE